MKEEKINIQRIIKTIKPSAPSLFIQNAEGIFDASIILCPTLGFKTSIPTSNPKRITNMLNTNISDGWTIIIMISLWVDSIK
jgi:hypothetical protein